MKNTELITLNNKLNPPHYSVLGAIKGVKVTYTVERNKNLLKRLVEDLQSAINKLNEAPEEHKEFEDKREALIKEHQKKNAEGQPLFQNGNPLVEDTFAPLFEKLCAEYPESWENNQKRQKDILELLQEDTEVDFFKIKMENVPEDVTSSQMEALFYMLEE